MKQSRLAKLHAALLVSIVILAVGGRVLALEPPSPADSRLVAGDLALSLSQVTGGLRLESLSDVRRKQEFLGTNSLPLFRVTLRRAGTNEETSLVADAGWERVTARRSRNRLELRWEKPRRNELDGISVVANAVAQPRNHSLHWDLRVEDKNPEWSVWRVVFPQLALASPGEKPAVLFPRGPGEVQPDIWKRPFAYRGNYPGGWCSMQFMAAYSGAEEHTGLYVGLHDPWGSTKDLFLESDPSTQTARMRFEIPAPDMGIPANGFTLSGQAVWQLLRGDWFDAAMIYKSWASKEARWWPRLVRGERADTAAWMRELNAWAQTGGGPSECARPVERFAAYLKLPVGFHWYSWHAIPFDNDYPHYFPAKDGFAAAVAELQRSNVFVMPYINGRLWDTHDRGAADFEFTRRALPAASKKENGEPFVESYGSKETNGEPVKLAAMCPNTALWQQTVRETVLRLLKNEGTRAVYIDQVAAAAPTLCMDKSHGHPLGGGHWWNEGYWTMLDTIRREMPRDAMLTTECNGEPFIRWFDGYLTWHWQYDGQVPVFPAIYGGAIQMFGRAYRGGATKDLALRMKAGQQLVFGEQLGWLDPRVADEPGNGEFFRQTAQVRSKVSRYFNAGQMARPPRLLGPMPKAKADWQWSGEWWVTTDALLSGAWQLPKEKRLVFLFANVGDESVTNTLRFDPAVYRLKMSKVRLTEISARDKGVLPGQQKCPFERELTFPPRQVRALELSW
ncbi:MAG TPA: DUF6259 domain-containing protein [Verrucomicrobiae bacterium]